MPRFRQHADSQFALPLLLPATRVRARRGQPVRPAAPRPIVFASGSNAPREILGFTQLGIPVGLASPEVTPAAERALLSLGGSGVPVFLDSGAFSEVSDSAADHVAAGLVPQPGVLLPVRPMTESDWLWHLDLALRLVRALGPQLFVVTPDQVGSQTVTLERLRKYAARLRELSAAGATLLFPVQQGERELAAFYAECIAAAGLPADALVAPSLPMRYGATPLDQAVAFVREVQPDRLHLLGMGWNNPQRAEVLAALTAAHPGVRISMDANMISANVGRTNGPGGGPRRLTQAEDDARHDHAARSFGALDFPDFDISIDYTDAIGEPDAWLNTAARTRVAEAARLTDIEAEAWHSDPTAFFHECDDDPDEPVERWQFDPIFALAVEAEWTRWVGARLAAPRRFEAIQVAFADADVGGQFART